MSDSDAEFGFLTLATPNDYLKAIALALSLRVSNPGVPIAIACSNKVRDLVEPYFDYVIEEKAGLRGFVHKVYLDVYSPFKTTVFFDSDVLVFKPVKPYVEAWSHQPYGAVGKYYTDGFGTFGLDRAAVMKKIGKPKLVEIGGAGHAIFYKPASDAVFDMAREVTANYKEIAGDIKYADEDVMNIVMTKMDIAPMIQHNHFLSRYLSGKSGTVKMDATKGLCRFISADNGEVIEPCMMHFACNEAPIPYTWQMYQLFKKFKVPTKGLLNLGISDIYEWYIKIRLHVYKNQLLKLFKVSS